MKYRKLKPKTQHKPDDHANQPCPMYPSRLKATTKPDRKVY